LHRVLGAAGPLPWTIERTGAWLGEWRRLRIRYDRGSERGYAMVLLACSVICFQALRPPQW
jgi:transposase